MVSPAALADTLFPEAGYRKHSLRHRVNPSSLQQPLEHKLLGLGPGSPFLAQELGRLA